METVIARKQSVFMYKVWKVKIVVSTIRGVIWTFLQKVDYGELSVVIAAYEDWGAR